MDTPLQTRNRLAGETSPYLLQHAGNPVDWYPWGEEALARARGEDKPVFLSIGYSACHWCHVMAHESFEDAETARLLNEYFVPVKVDREERPDLDQVYQAAVQAMIGQGGWPLSVFLTPGGEPFYGGTYFPPEPAYGRPGFKQVLEAAARAWRERPADLREAARRLAGMLAGEETPAAGGVEAAPGPEVAEDAVRALAAAIDRRHGGFGRAPKFPGVPALMLMMSHGRLRGEAEPVELALFTLRRMARGGIHDQLGGGFHRYATDDRWHVPHFEKMLYDQALLLGAYTDAWRIAGEEESAAVARGIMAYLKRELTAPEGAFYASQEADSEGEEGKYYAWPRREAREALGEDRLFAVAELVYGLGERGGFEGGSVLRQALSVRDAAAVLGRPEPEVRADLERARALLLAAREERVKPARDEKIIAAWNGLAISGLARAGRALDDQAALDAAARAARFVLGAMRADGPHLFRIHAGGRAAIPAMLDDYAFLTAGLLDLYESDFDPAWLKEALALQRVVSEEFRRGDGRYVLNAAGGEIFAPALSARDHAIPAGAAIHCQNLVRLHALTGDAGLDAEAEDILAAHARGMAEDPFGYATLIAALEMRAVPVTAAVAGWDAGDGEALRRLRRAFVPHLVTAGSRAGEDTAGHPAAAMLAGKEMQGGVPAFYICKDRACLPPQTEWEALAKILGVEDDD